MPQELSTRNVEHHKKERDPREKARFSLRDWTRPEKTSMTSTRWWWFSEKNQRRKREIQWSRESPEQCENITQDKWRQHDWRGEGTCQAARIADEAHSNIKEAYKILAKIVKWNKCCRRSHQGRKWWRLWSRGKWKRDDEEYSRLRTTEIRRLERWIWAHRERDCWKDKPAYAPGEDMGYFICRYVRQLLVGRLERDTKDNLAKVLKCIKERANITADADKLRWCEAVDDTLEIAEEIANEQKREWDRKCKWTFCSELTLEQLKNSGRNYCTLLKEIKSNGRYLMSHQRFDGNDRWSSRTMKSAQARSD